MINSLTINDVVAINMDNIENHILTHYKNLFNKIDGLQDNGIVNETIPNLVSKKSNRLLTLIPSDIEIKDAFMNLKRDSAPRLDGFGASFFQLY